MLEGIMIGLGTAFSLTNLLMVIGGCLIGTFIGMLPGLGPMSIISIMIPVAISIGDPSAALILLAGVYYGAIFGGSTSSILINAPGVASTVATSFDGYPLARQGKAGKALTVAAISSFTGGTIGAVLLMIFAPALATVALLLRRFDERASHGTRVECSSRLVCRTTVAQGRTQATPSSSAAQHNHQTAQNEGTHETTDRHTRAHDCSCPPPHPTHRRCCSSSSRPSPSPRALVWRSRCSRKDF